MISVSFENGSHGFHFPIHKHSLNLFIQFFLLVLGFFQRKCIFALNNNLKQTPMKKTFLLLLAAIALPAWSQRDASVRIYPDKGTTTINKNMYGHFAEHLGSCIYGGLWVGPDSDIPNTQGYRTDVLEALKKLQVPVLPLRRLLCRPHDLYGGIYKAVRSHSFSNGPGGGCGRVQLASGSVFRRSRSL